MAKPTKTRTKRPLTKKAKPAKPKAKPAKPKAKPAKPKARPAKPKAKPAKPKAKPAKPKARPAKSTARPAKPAKPAKPDQPQPAKRVAAQPAEQVAVEPDDALDAGIAGALDAGLDDPGRTSRIATMAAERARLAVDDHAPVVLGSITVPSGTVAIFDIGLMGYLPRPALDPMLICADVPTDRALPVIGTRVGSGRFAACWDHVVIQLAVDPPPITRARKLGEAAVDFARLICMDRAALDHWQHEDSLDQLADFIFWGRDEAALAKALGARRLAAGEGHGWHDLPIAEAEALADRAAALKAEHKWLLSAELRPHSHHFDVLAAARASPTGAGVLELAGARVLLFFTSWGEGVFPVFLDLDADGHAVQLRIQLAKH